MNVIERIQEKYGEMTKKQRVLADYMLENPDSMSFMTMKNLSSRTQVSEMTILHYCGALGYGNYNELKYEFRKYINLTFSNCCLPIWIFHRCSGGPR